MKKIVIASAVLACSIAPLSSQANTSTYKDFRSRFRQIAANEFGYTTWSMDSGVVLFRRSWLFSAAAEAIRFASPSIAASWNGLTVPQSDLPPVPLTLHKGFVIVKVCHGSGCGMFAIVCNIGCGIADIAVSAAATAINEYLAIANGTNIGTFTAQNIVVSGHLTSTSVDVGTDSMGGRVTVTANADGTVHVKGRLGVDITGPAQFQLACTGFSQALDNDVSPSSLNASTSVRLELTGPHPNELQFVGRVGDISIQAKSLNLPSIFNPYWTDPRQYFGCPDPLVGVLEPVATALAGNFYHPDVAFTLPLNDSLPIASVGEMDLDAAHAISTPRNLGDGVGAVVTRRR